MESLPIGVIYCLLKTYCMPLYGSQLCDIGCTAIAKLNIARRKAIRYILHLPRITYIDSVHTTNRFGFIMSLLCQFNKMQGSFLEAN